MTWPGGWWWGASGGPVPVPSSGDIHLNSAMITALLIGIPSVIVAVRSYWLSIRARREQAEAEDTKVDAEAFARAKDVYESAIAELRRQVADLRADLIAARDENRQLRTRPPPRRR